MIGLIQRVSQARVEIENKIVASINAGLLLFLCIEKNDAEAQCDQMLSRVIKLRIFSDKSGNMNNSLMSIDGLGSLGGLLVVSQFTLAADLSSGSRPCFSSAADPNRGRVLYDYFLMQATKFQPDLQKGQFGKNMQVTLVNDGPVTILLRVTSSMSDS
tara:strand:- start:419 stop:892 length:474 start_codon:yes stop_codon:yes gene_type:complete